ncbi:hypothetical protein PVAP13_6NG250000 [Panicum virgatum]|uniref:Uncharacterized protein n=1 Tax=Panicum virgatum TaxID=38727 RepID=A0A8T0R046_PANVG|nr:hypothetical protein PVAP13_6NG250000 [Panicum virgatum]
MAASATQPDHHGAAAGADRPRGAKHRRPLLNHLHIQVPTIPANSGWFGRHSGPATAPCGAQASAHGHRHAADQPASPSLLRSPSAWIRGERPQLRPEQAHAPPLREFSLRRAQLRAELRRGRRRGGRPQAPVLLAQRSHGAAAGLAVVVRYGRQGQWRLGASSARNCRTYVSWTEGIFRLGFSCRSTSAQIEKV